MTISPITERPLLLVDVDGVLNPMRKPSPDFATHECVVAGGVYRVHLNPKHGAELLVLAEETGSELVWATTWEHAANEWIGPRIGLPGLPVIEMPTGPPRHRGVGSYGEMFKTPHVAKYVTRRPFVWFDDQTWEADEDYLREHAAVGDFLLVQVDPMRGLVDEDLTRAREWLEGRPERENG